MSREKEVKIRQELIEIAESLVGAPFKYGAYLEEYSDNQTAFDCSSFIQYVFKRVGIDLPRSTILQAAALGREVTGKRGDEVMPGDVIFYEGERGHYRHDLFPERKIYIGHAALFVGDSYVIHATNNSTASGVVKQAIILLPPQYHRVILIKRFL